MGRKSVFILTRWSVLVVLLGVLPLTVHGQILRALPFESSGNSSAPNSINASGVVVGADDFYFAAVWSPTPTGYVRTMLPSLPGADETMAFAINDTGEIVGDSVAGGASSETAVVWAGAPGSYTLQPLSVTGIISQANGINNGGDVIGSDSVETTPFPPALHTFGRVWFKSTSYSSQQFPVGVYASAINNNRDIVQVDETDPPNVTSYVLPYNGAGYPSDPSQVKPSFSAAPVYVSAINDHGTGAGSYNNNQPLVMTLANGIYSANSLPLPAGVPGGDSVALNDQDVIVGTMGNAPDTRDDKAALWMRNGTQWTVVDLDNWFHQVDPTAAAQWKLTNATAINDSGLVAGYGQFDPGGPPGHEVVQLGFVLDVSSLLPEPAWLSVMIGGAGLLRRPRRLR